MRIWMVLLVPALALTLSGCGPSAPDAPTETSELTRRQKDSLVAEMPLPGAGAVGKALGALEATERRAQAHDTIS